MQQPSGPFVRFALGLGVCHCDSELDLHNTLQCGARLYNAKSNVARVNLDSGLTGALLMLGKKSERILVVDQEGIMRDGLCALLDAEEELHVVGAIPNGAGAVEAA